MPKGFVSEGGLEHTFEGKFPGTGKFPWRQHSGQTSARYVFKFSAFPAGLRADDCAVPAGPWPCVASAVDGGAVRTPRGLAGHTPH